MNSVKDIFNRPPAISEDTLQYTLYPQDDISDRASATTLATLMHEHVDSLLPGFLWHRDAFELKVVQNPDCEGWVLEGRMRVGDCVDDEWCAVWLLREISAKWDVTISVLDSDGEFILIEAAEALPSWVTPSNAENRVWIYRSRLHLIPLSYVSAPSSKPRRRRYPGAKDSDEEGDMTQIDDDEDYITVQDAIKLVRDPLVDTFAPAEVEQTVWTRLSGYPTAARQHVHVAKAYLPVDIAKALAVDPSLVQKPTETFYTRDAIQLRAAHKMTRFPPEPSILTTVKMTRTAYAQLAGQKFYPPKVFGRWQEKEDTTEWRWRDVGMKIACGFEMLYQESKDRTDTVNVSAEAMQSSAQARKEALHRSTEYVKYIQNLVSSGYFKGELEGSKLWNELEDKATAVFLEVRREDDAGRPSFAAAVNATVSKAAGAPIPPAQREEDSDEWLNVNAEDFESMLEKNFGGNVDVEDQGPLPDAMDIDKQTPTRESEEDRVAREQASKLKNLAKKVEEFIEGEGDIEGARFADEEFSDEDFSEDEHMSEDGSEAPTPPLTEQTEAQRVARQAAMDKLVPGILPSEYGKMPPSFHSNSQRVAPITIETETREVPTKGSDASAGLRKRPIRPPILPRDKYEGVDSDDETDGESGGEGDEEDEEDKPQVVGDVEIDMNEEEDEFLEFARQALGISDEQWGDIVKERTDRGAYVPLHVVAENTLLKKTATSTHYSAPELAFNTPSRKSAAGPRPDVNPNLDSFEAVMRAMDAELAQSRKRKHPPPSQTDKGKGKAKESLGERHDILDIEAAMDAELEAALEKEHDGDGDEVDAEEAVDYNLIKNFLQSYKSQAGLSGPVGNLAGRLQSGWMLPRDES
ncbi:uncharacterized protein LAESUDRAFT_679939 [Laetiporus sulphureus 93-53]|uniref:SGT1-domain-containing protein n=1 Tax=Laetiporus sulphureus 93-53 TaxID=1314785 RepID=A0A165E6S4_9APHY|nr:uncharacterized protein LAESUDRAFT_679939 [Laetiporus sulphureus 93-53]KZT06347.1 hypothetical protein LAESUDRAFT_679939 [Laetiporus sulphureus 93-53]